MASLRGAPMRLRFLDGGRRLLAQGIVTSSGYESGPNGLSEVNLAVWDLATGALEGVQRHRMDELTQAALSVDLTSDAAALAWAVEEQAAAELPHPLVMRRWDAMACGRGTDVGIAVAPSAEATAAPWLSIDRLVVDPLGRWVATFRSFPQGDVIQAELVVQALADGRVLWRRKLADPVGGAVATADGTRLLGLAFSPKIPDAADGVRASGDAVLEFPIDVQGLRAVAPLADAPRCGVDGAPPEARNVARPVHALTPLWQRVLDPVARTRVGEPIANAPACTFPDTFDTQDADGVFFRPDGTMWVDRFSGLAQVDPGTGKTLRTLPTPRSPLVCSVVSPAADGFFNIQGDTLTWRPLEVGSAPRRVVDQRPGWTALELSTIDRAVRVGWVARESLVKPPADGNVDDFVVALYAANGHRVSQQAQNYGGYDIVGDSAAPLYASAFMPACADAAGPIVDAMAWQVDVFGSLRARACGAAGAPARTLMWTDTDIRPRPGTPRNHFPDPKAAAHDGAVVVMQDQRGLRVFDVDQRRELGQVTGSDGHVTSMAVSAAQSLLVIKGFISNDNGQQVVLTAYRLR